MNLIATNAVSNFCNLVRREIAGSNTDLCCMRRTVNFARKEGYMMGGQTVTPAHGGRGGAVGRGTAPQAGRSRVRLLMVFH